MSEGSPLPTPNSATANLATDDQRIQAVLQSTTTSDVDYARPTSQSPFRFVDLPGELRNRIYEFCIPPPSLYTQLFRHGRHPFHPTPQRTFRGLTQANQQIRTEYNTMYFGDNTSDVVLKPSSLDAIVMSFLVPYSKATWNLMIDVGKGPEGGDGNESVDIKPLVMLAGDRARKLEYSFHHIALDEVEDEEATEAAGDYVYALNCTFSNITSDGWRAYITNAVKKILVQRHDCLIVVRKAFWEGWMGEEVMVDGINGSQEMKQWMAKVEYPVLSGSVKMNFQLDQTE